MKLISKLLIIVLSLFMFSCEQLQDLLTEEEIAEGLKSALIVGTDTSVANVSAVDGYYEDEIIKILLPPDAEIIYEYKDDPLLVSLGLSALIDDVVLKMNRAAEDAAKEATPIFVNAITSMTIIDAIDILNGNDTAATHYLRGTTYNDLKNLFQPKINNSLDKPLVGGVSTNESWETMTSTYNSVAETFAGQLIGLTPVNTDLSEYVTQKSLNGLFLKVSEEERDIREDPLARVNDILKKVFGSID